MAGAGDLGGATAENGVPSRPALRLPDGPQVCIVYSTLDPSRPLRRPLISFPPPLPPPRTCLLVTGKNSAAPKRTASSALDSAGCRGQKEKGGRGGGGGGAGK